MCSFFTPRKDSLIKIPLTKNIKRRVVVDQYTIQTRIKHKTDTFENWKATGDDGFIPLKGEIIVYTFEEGAPYQIKIGDGLSNVNLLPYVSGDTEIPLYSGGGTNSIKQHLENYEALSQSSACLGSNNIAGIKGYYFNNIDFTNKVIRITDVQPGVRDTTKGNATSEVGLSPNIEFNTDWQVYDVISVVNSSKYDAKLVITAIDHDLITVATLTDAYTFLGYDQSTRAGTKGKACYDTTADLPFTAVKNVIPDYDDYGVVNIDKPSSGIFDLAPYAYAEGVENIVTGAAAHVEGKQNKSLGHYSHTEGRKTFATYVAHAEGYMTQAIGQGAHAEGHKAQALQGDAHAEGFNTRATGRSAHAEGSGSQASGDHAHAEGSSKATNTASHAEGVGTEASGYAAHSEGQSTKAGGIQSHAEGFETEASAQMSHAEGNKSKATNIGAHAEGHNTEASGTYSHTEGANTRATQSYSHAGGSNSIAEHEGAFLHGRNLNSSRDYQTVVGTFNATNSSALFQVGAGDSTGTRNAFEVLSDSTFNYRDYTLGYTNIDNVTRDIRNSISKNATSIKENNNYLTTTLNNIVGKNYKEVQTNIVTPGTYLPYNNTYELIRVTRTDEQLIYQELPKIYNISGNILDKKCWSSTYSRNGINFEWCDNGGIHIYGTSNGKQTQYVLIPGTSSNTTTEQRFRSDIILSLFDHTHSYYMNNNSETNKYINSNGESKDIVRLQLGVSKPDGSVYYPNTVSNTQPIHLKEGEKVTSVYLQINTIHEGRVIDTVLYPTITIDTPSSSLLGNYEGRIDEIPYDTFWALHPYGRLYIDSNIDAECKLSFYGNKNYEQISNINKTLSNKSNTGHKHYTSDISNLQTTLDSKLEEAKSYTDESIDNIKDTLEQSIILDENNLPVVPYEKGGTNATTLEEAKNNLGVSRIEDLLKHIYGNGSVGLDYKFNSDTCTYSCNSRGNSTECDITIPSSVMGIPVKHIDSYAFMEDKMLYSLTFDGIEHIGEYAFKDSYITNINFGYSLNTIDKYSFENCTKLEGLNIKSTVSTIGDYAFKNCSHLGVISIDEPKDVLVIEANAFSGAVIEGVSFGGSSYDWSQKVIIKEGNEALISAPRSYLQIEI